MVEPIVMFVEPMVVQLDPSAERDAVKVLPTRCTRTQYGALSPLTVIDEDEAPVLVRHWNETPAPGVTKHEPCVELALSDSRIITPAFAQGSVFCTPVTRA